MVKRRTTTRKLKDKWKAKSWYKIRAPEMFNFAEVGETPASDAAKLKDRMVEVTVAELTGNMSKMHFKLKFKVWNIKDHSAYTKFAGHELTSDYLRRMVRRRRSKIEAVFDVKTSDGYVLRIKPMAVTDVRIQSSQKRAIRKIIQDTIANMVKKMTLGEVVKCMINDDFVNEVKKRARSVHPLRTVAIRKSEVILTPAEALRLPQDEQEEREEQTEDREKAEVSP